MILSKIKKEPRKIEKKKSQKCFNLKHVNKRRVYSNNPSSLED